MTGLLERLGVIVHLIGLVFTFLFFIDLADNFDRLPSENGLYLLFGTIIWWPTRWVLTGRTSIKPISPREFTND